MKLAFFNQYPWQNEYASRMFLNPLMEYASRKGVPVKSVDRLVPEHGWAHISNADFLTPAVVQHFKENDCPIYGISCIDSAYPSETLRGPHLADVTKLFMVSGVQNTNFSEATVIDPDFTIRTEKRRFLPDDEWAVFDAMRKAGRILSLPYVPWRRFPDVAPVPFEQKRPTVLFRGGNHLLRFVAFLMALRNGCEDSQSGFQTRAYFEEDMNPKFRYCQECRNIFNRANYYPFGQENPSTNCQSEAPWGGDGVDMSVPGLWNNRCLESFYWLSKQFSERYGPIDMSKVERALNYHNQPEDQHLTAISGARFYAECKWEFSIHMPQRFWEAASVGTVNLLPDRANDQDYFPKLEEAEHYFNFDSSMEQGMHAHILHKSLYTEVADRTLEIYRKWIQPTDFVTNTNLLLHMLEEIIEK